MMGILLIEMVMAMEMVMEISFNLVVIVPFNKTKHSNLLHGYYFDLQNEITTSRQTYLHPSLIAHC